MKKERPTIIRPWAEYQAEARAAYAVCRAAWPDKSNTERQRTRSNREALAIRLFKRAEHLDPSSDSDSEADDWGWSKLKERTREFWRLLADEALL
jgi:hypothetical protein